MRPERAGTTDEIEGDGDAGCPRDDGPRARPGGHSRRWRTAVDRDETGISRRRTARSAAEMQVFARIGLAWRASGGAGAVIGHQMDRQAQDLQGDLGQNASVERVGEGIAVTFASGILYPFNSVDILPAGRENLRQLAQSLQRYPGTEVLIVGHTD